jgi:hypothetical protein
MCPSFEYGSMRVGRVQFRIPLEKERIVHILPRGGQDGHLFDHVIETRDDLEPFS